MTMWNWRYYIGAAILVVFFLVRYGAPLFPVLAGIAIAGTLMWRNARRPS